MVRFHLAMGIWPPLLQGYEPWAAPISRPGGRSECGLAVLTTAASNTPGDGSQYSNELPASLVNGNSFDVVIVPEDELDRGTVGASEDAGLSGGSIVFGFYSFGSLVC